MNSNTNASTLSEPFQDSEQTPPPPPPPTTTLSATVPEQKPEQEEEEEEEEQARCEWEFSTAVSTATPPSWEVSDAIGAIDFDLSGDLLATGGIARKLRIYNLTSLLHQKHSASCDFYICTPAKLSSLRWRPSERHLIGCSDYDGVVTEYDVERRLSVFERDEHAGRRVWSLDYSPDGRLAASASDDSTAHLWDVRQGAAAVAVARAGGAVCTVEFDPDGGPHVALGSADRRAYVYDVRAMEAGPAAVLSGHGRAVTYVRFCGGRWVVTSGTDGTHRLWEWEDGRHVRTYRGHTCGRSFVGMSVWRGGQLVGGGSESNEVFVYDLRWPQPIWVWPFRPNGNEGDKFVSAVSWWQASEDEAVLAAGGSDGGLQVFVGKKKLE